MMEKTTLNQRIEALVWAFKLTRRKFALQVGLSPTGFNKIISGETVTPGADIIQGILDSFPEVNPTWLMTGEGEMMRNGETTTQKAKEAPVTDSAILAELKSMRSEFSRLVSVLETQSELLRKPSGSRNFLMVPPLRVA